MKLSNYIKSTNNLSQMEEFINLKKIWILEIKIFLKKSVQTFKNWKKKKKKYQIYMKIKLKHFKKITNWMLIYSIDNARYILAGIYVEE